MEIISIKPYKLRFLKQLLKGQRLLAVDKGKQADSGGY